MSGIEANGPVNGGGSFQTTFLIRFVKLSVHENIIERLSLIAADQKLGLRRSSSKNCLLAGEPQSGKPKLPEPWLIRFGLMRKTVLC